MGRSERLTLDQALRSITTNAAYVLAREDEIGSLRAGEMAVFAVLDEDPYEIPIENLNDIPAHGTVFTDCRWRANKTRFGRSRHTPAAAGSHTPDTFPSTLSSKILRALTRLAADLERPVLCVLISQ